MEIPKQNRKVLTHNLDIQGFKYDLQGFAALKQVTLALVLHGFIFMSVYRTPTIQTIRYDLSYKFPSGYPTANNCVALHGMLKMIRGHEADFER